MKRLGFSLAEVLIALTLVGIVTALILPTFVSENQKKSQSAALSTAVSNFEMAMRSMMIAEDVTDLYDTNAWRGLPNAGLDNTSTDAIARQFMGNIGEYLEISRQDTILNLYNGAPNIKQVNSNSVGREANQFVLEKQGYVDSSGMFYLVSAVKQDNNHVNAANALNNVINLTDTAGFVAIDVNGAKAPNKVGRDVFYFVLGADGVLYPYGSKDAEYKLSNGRNNNNWNAAGTTYQCRDASITRDGMGCTARLIETGYKMDY